MSVVLPVPDMEALAAALRERLVDPPAASLFTGAVGELTLTVESGRLPDVLTVLRDREPFQFDQLVDLCGVDYSTFAAGYGSLYTQDAFSVGAPGSAGDWNGERFAVVCHLLSIVRNHRLRVRTFLADEEGPVCPSVTGIWPAAQWYEREAFDLFGIVFTGHSDLRRLLTDYGFIGHPFRKDFPVEGKVEMRYDPAKGRVVYQPVTITPREVVPRIRRTDSFGSS